MKRGTIKFYNEAKGYGFIIDSETQSEIFVHVTGLAGGKIKQDDTVQYETKEGKKGLNAVNVKRV